MQKIVLLLFIIFFSMTEGLTQTCLPNGIFFNNQAVIDSFQINYPNCEEIGGNVAISGNDITNLLGLNTINSISGDLYLGVTMNDNPLLTNLSGLESLTYIGGQFGINGNTALTNLTGLDNIENIVEWCYILYNDELTDLTGLENLTSFTSGLTIESNSALTSLAGMENITSIGGGLAISRNEVLNNIEALEELNYIGGVLVINYSDNLSSLEGLNNIDAESISNLHITNNHSLTTCEVESVCNYLVNPSGDITIFDNATGCDSEEEVLQACSVGFSQNDEDGIVIFPNPADMVINISQKLNTLKRDISIYNCQGIRVLKQEIKSKSIDISNLHQGLYFLEISTNELIIRKKLIIK